MLRISTYTAQVNLSHLEDETLCSFLISSISVPLSSLISMATYNPDALLTIIPSQKQEQAIYDKQFIHAEGAYDHTPNHTTTFTTVNTLSESNTKADCGLIEIDHSSDQTKVGLPTMGLIFNILKCLSYGTIECFHGFEVR